MRLFTILFFLVIITGCISTKSVPFSGHQFKSTSVFEEGKSDGTILGSVIDQETGEPILFGTVSLLDSNMILIDKTDTNLEGQFIFSDIPPQKYAFEISYVGYSPLKIEVFNLEKGEVKQLKMPMAFSNMGCCCVVVSYKIPLIQMDETTSGASFTNDDLKRMAW